MVEHSPKILASEEKATTTTTNTTTTTLACGRPGVTYIGDRALTTNECISLVCLLAVQALRKHLYSISILFGRLLAHCLHS